MSLTVERVHTQSGSHIEPPLEESWSNLEKLRWRAAVIECDTGVRVEVRDDGSLGGPGWGLSRSSFDHTWSLLTGFALGAEHARRQLP